jgi:hypothetical protein
MNREQLIARKHEVIAERRRLQRELAGLRGDSWRQRHRKGDLQRRIERLQAEEYRLRLEIDRSR